MMAWEWVAQGLMVLVPLGCLPFLLRFERRVGELRALQSALAESAAGVSEAARAAGPVLSGLREVLEAVRTEHSRLHALRDDVLYLSDRADALGNRLEALVARGRPAAPGVDRAVELAAAFPASQAERELMRSLGRMS